MTTRPSLFVMFLGALAAWNVGIALAMVDEGWRDALTQFALGTTLIYCAALRHRIDSHRVIA